MRALMPLVLLAASAPALAQPAPCLQAGRSTEYNARPLSLHEVIARNAFGADRQAWRIGTTCIHVDRTAIVALRSMTRCLTKGDEVAVAAIDGHRESCRVTGVTPAPDGYDQAKYR